MLPVLILVFIAFGLAMTMMAVGVMFSGRCLRGSCGGTQVFGPDGNPLTCATCPNKDKHKTDECDDDDDTCPRKNVPVH